MEFATLNEVCQKRVSDFRSLPPLFRRQKRATWFGQLSMKSSWLSHSAHVLGLVCDISIGSDFLLTALACNAVFLVHLVCTPAEQIYA